MGLALAAFFWIKIRGAGREKGFLMDKNSRCWTRKGFFSKNLFPIQHLEFLSKKCCQGLPQRARAPFLGEKNRSLIRHIFRLQNHLQIK